VALTLRYAVRSDLGLVRGNNEDSVYAGPRLLAIADGMGGHAAGEVASKIVISTLESLDDIRSSRDLIGALRDAVMEANQRIGDAVEQNKSLDGMGTTLTALHFAGSQVALVHVGDSRAYQLRGDLLSQITHDDTYVQYLVDSGKLTPDEAWDHPRKSVILRALRGTEVEPDVSIRESRAGDRYLLCSDGLSDVVSTETILETLRIPDPQECADRLVELALRGGGPDNVTVIVADVVDSRPGDVVDDVPVIAGAFVDPAAADVPGTDSPAERAASMARPRAATPAEPGTTREPRRGGRWRTPVLILAILAVIGGGLGGTYAWAQTQYYVGRAGSEVVIYRGVNTAFGPLKFSEVYQNTDLKLADLNPSWRSQVKAGITAQSKSDAENIVHRLHGEQLPLCSTASPSAPATSTPAAPSSSVTRSATPTVRSSASRSRRPAGRTSAHRRSAAPARTHRSATHHAAASSSSVAVSPAPSLSVSPSPSLSLSPSAAPSAPVSGASSSVPPCRQP
jgi:protein phosphatase